MQCELQSNIKRLYQSAIEQVAFLLSDGKM